jgi:hypothetical protein
MMRRTVTSRSDPTLSPPQFRGRHQQDLDPAVFGRTHGCVLCALCVWWGGGGPLVSTHLHDPRERTRRAGGRVFVAPRTTQLAAWTAPITTVSQSSASISSRQSHRSSSQPPHSCPTEPSGGRVAGFSQLLQQDCRKGGRHAARGDHPALTGVQRWNVANRNVNDFGWGVAHGDSPLHDGTSYRGVKRTTLGFGICPSFKGHFLSPVCQTLM